MRLTADRAVTWSEPSAPAGITTEKVYLGPDPHGLGGFQVAVATSEAAPARQAIKGLFVARRGRTPIQLIVAVVHDNKVHLFGPDPQAQPIELPVEQAARQLQSILSEPDVLAATERCAGLRKASDATGVAGFTNSGLFATHHILSNLPQRTDWEELGAQAVPLLVKRGRQLVQGCASLSSGRALQRCSTGRGRRVTDAPDQEPCTSGTRTKTLQVRTDAPCTQVHMYPGRSVSTPSGVTRYRPKEDLSGARSTNGVRVATRCSEQLTARVRR